MFNPSTSASSLLSCSSGARGGALDFWWAPLSPAMVIAYAVIVIGGLVIPRRAPLAAVWRRPSG